MAGYDSSQLLKLASEINQLTGMIVHYLSSQGVSEPSFASTSTDVPRTREYFGLTARLNDSLNDLHRLANGPKTYLRTLFTTQHDLAAFQTAFDFNFFEAVPEDHGILLKDLADHVGIDMDLVGRIMRMLVTHRVFAESGPDKFTHTASSILFHRDAQVRDTAHYQLDEMFKAAAETAACIHATPNRTNASNCPFTSRHGVPLFQYYQQNPQLARRFASGMAGFAKLDSQLDDLSTVYPWNELGGGKLVDIGGGNGHVSMVIASKVPGLELVVQDGNEEMIAQGAREGLPNLSGRVSFMRHDFFETQSQRINGKGAFFMRQILHNWNDADCVRILRSMVEAMANSSPDVPLLVNDIVLPEPGSATLFEERQLRQTDIMMMVALGAKQRTAADFQALFYEADPRLEIAKIHSTGRSGFLEIRLSQPA